MIPQFSLISYAKNLNRVGKSCMVERYQKLGQRFRRHTLNLYSDYTSDFLEIEFYANTV